MGKALVCVGGANDGLWVAYSGKSLVLYVHPRAARTAATGIYDLGESPLETECYYKEQMALNFSYKKDIREFWRHSSLDIDEAMGRLWDMLWNCLESQSTGKKHIEGG